MIRSLISFYSTRYPTILTYMLQKGGYKVRPYLKLLGRARDFNKVMESNGLKRTPVAMAILQILRLGIGLEIAGGILMIIFGINGKLPGGIYFGLAVVIVYPLLWAYLLPAIVFLGRSLSRINYR